MPVTVSIHFPDALNDARNPHIHVVRGKRRLQIAPSGELMRDDDGNVICERVMPPAFTALDSKHRLREEVARLANVELERLGADYRLTPGTDAAIGNDGATMVKLHKQATVLARAGVPTEERLDNALIGWSRQFDAVEHNRVRAIAREQRRAKALARKLELMAARGHDVTELRTAADDSHALAVEGITAAHEARSIALMIAAARSGPQEVMQFAPGYGAEAARRSASYDAAGWRRR